MGTVDLTIIVVYVVGIVALCRATGLPGDRHLVLVRRPDNRATSARRKGRKPCPDRAAVRRVHENSPSIRVHPPGADLLRACPARSLAGGTQFRYQAMCDNFGDILPVRKVGQTHIWFTPWDYLIRWWGIQEAMVDLIERPELVHASVERMVDAWMVELDQFIALNLLALDANNTRIGSGGYGYTKQLPDEDYDPNHVKPYNMWGCSNAQIFSEVSPQMHWEFALKHDLRWLARWRLTYYGCCEPLDRKVDLLRKIPNLRKVSISPRCNTERAVQQIGSDYVLSRKPNPAIFAEDAWHPERARQDLREFLEKAHGCHVELIMKDISTVRRQPQRLWEWARIAREVADEFTR